MSNQITNFSAFVGQLRSHMGGGNTNYAGIFTGEESFKTIMQSDYKMTAEEANMVLSTTKGVLDFLQKSNMLVAQENFDMTAGVPEFRRIQMNQISMDDVCELVDRAKINERFRSQAIMAVGQLMARACAHSDSGSYRNSFFSNERVGLNRDSGDPSRNTLSLFSGVTAANIADHNVCLLYTSPSPRD